jgi:hypothetical protein
MPTLNRPLVKDIVARALQRVADFDGDIESFTFRRFGAFHKEFLAALKAGIVEVAGPTS